jgi:hypothetical protein
MRFWRIFEVAVLLLADVIHCEPVIFPLVHPLAGGGDVPYDRGYGAHGEEESADGVPGGWHGRLGEKGTFSINAIKLINRFVFF